MTVMHTLLALLFAAWSAGMFAMGYGVGWARADIAPAQIRVTTPAELGMGPSYHDAVAGPWVTGVIALGVTGRVESVKSDGDAAALRIDRRTGRVLAKCDGE